MQQSTALSCTQHNINMSCNTPDYSIDDGVNDGNNGSTVGAMIAVTKFHAEGDNLIARAWIKTTNDPKCGMAQRGNNFYQKLFNHFKGWLVYANSKKRAGENLIPEGCTLNAIKQHWLTLQRGVNIILNVHSCYPKKIR